MGSMIFALLNERPNSLSVLNAADHLSDLVGNLQIAAVAIRAEPVKTIPSTEDMLSKDDEQKLRDAENCRVRSLHWTFKLWSGTTERQSTPYWMDRECDIKALIKDYCDEIDYVVTSQPKNPGTCTEKEMICCALFKYKKFVLVTPPRYSSGLGRSVALICHDTKRLRDQVLSFIPILSQANDIHLILKPGAEDPTRVMQTLLPTATPTIHVHRSLGRLSMTNKGEKIIGILRKFNTDLLIINNIPKSNWRFPLFYRNSLSFILKNCPVPVLLGRPFQEDCPTP